MLTLAQASSFFDRTPVFDPTGVTRLFYGQVGLFDDSKRDAGSAYRRVLSLAPGTALPNPPTAKILGQVWNIGRKETDGLEEMHRDKYVLQACTGEYTLTSLTEYTSGVNTPATIQRWAGVEWVKDAKEIGSSSDSAQVYTIFLPEGTPITEMQLVVAPGGAEVYIVTTDTHFSHKVWHETSPAVGKAQFPLVGDPTHQLTRAFGVHIEEEGLALRGTFIINPDGVIKTLEIHDNAIARDVSETLRKLKAAQFVAANPGQVCPAKWKEGAETLKPSLDLVGKI